MTRKTPSKPAKALAKTASPPQKPHRLAGGTTTVPADAIYHVPEVSPTRTGPWSGEADKIAWTDATTGYPCIIRRAASGAHLCGYVGVPPTHPLYGRRAGTLADTWIGAHGGIDYAEPCAGDEPEDRSVCHVHESEARGHDDAWWFGFSCDRAGDIIPNAMPGSRSDRLVDGVVSQTYKTEAFVYRECVRLAVQLQAIAQGRDPREVDPGPVADDWDPRRTGR